MDVIDAFGTELISVADMKVGYPVVIGSDNAGYQLKMIVADLLRQSGIPYIDVNPEEGSAPNYPLVSHEAAKKIMSGEAKSGILVCGTGIGIGIAAAKCPGVYPARCDDATQARIARRETNANMVTFGQRVTGPGTALDLVCAFFTTAYDEENGVFGEIKAQEDKYFGGAR